MLGWLGGLALAAGALVGASVAALRYRGGLALRWLIAQASPRALGGSTVRINGPLRLHGSVTRPVLVVHGLAWENRPGFPGTFLRLDFLSLQFGLGTALRSRFRRLSLPAVYLDGLQVNLLRDAQGRANWEFVPPVSPKVRTNTAPARPAIARTATALPIPDASTNAPANQPLPVVLQVQLQVRDCHIAFSDAVLGLNCALKIASASFEAAPK